MKRHEALVQLSRDHHFGLLLCWKLKEGLKKDISVERMSKYIVLFYEQNLKPHFAEEEETIFLILGNSHPLIEEAISQHRELEKMISDGITTIIEVGPGKVLSGFNIMISREIKSYNVEDVKSLEDTIIKLGE